MTEVCTLTVTGNPYEQGVQEGKELRGPIGRNIQAARRLAGAVRTGRAYQAFLQDHLRYLGGAFPELVEEMKGIAAGSGFSYADIIELNVPAYFFSERFAPECSMILARGRATEDGKTYIIKNRDMRAPVEQVLIRRRYADGVMLAEVAGAGTVTYPASGLNGSGLGITTTGFWSSKVTPDLERGKYGQIFWNIHVLLRQCHTVREALSLLESLPVMNGLNLLLADKREACAVEMTADKQVVQWDQGEGLLYRTNHYISKELSPLNPDGKEYPSTFYRRARIGALLKPHYGHLRFQDLYRILSDHENGINSVCRHPVNASPAKTVSTTLVVLEDQEIWTTLDNPCIALPHVSL